MVFIFLHRSPQQKIVFASPWSLVQKVQPISPSTLHSMKLLTKHCFKRTLKRKDTEGHLLPCPHYTVGERKASQERGLAVQSPLLSPRPLNPNDVVWSLTWDWALGSLVIHLKQKKGGQDFDTSQPFKQHTSLNQNVSIFLYISL